jgi:bla regulator protein BlaR1
MRLSKCSPPRTARGSPRLLAVAIAASTALHAQSPNLLDWQTLAGGRQTFEVASVKPAKSWHPPNVPLSTGDAKPYGGRFSAIFPLIAYITFAYKLPPYLAEATTTQLPKWATTVSFEIDARAAGDPTKDQMRLMMQSLLADRFKLAVHFETREGPVLALTLVKPGQTGAKLRPHAEGPPCADFAPLSAAPLDVFPSNCGMDQLFQDARGRRIGYRNGTMERIAETIGGYAGLAGEADKPVVDRTGLTGTYDFFMEYTPGENDQLAHSLPPNPDGTTSELQGTMFLTAIREQLGLKLVRARGAIRTLVIDHVEQPSEN